MRHFATRESSAFRQGNQKVHTYAFVTFQSTSDISTMAIDTSQKYGRRLIPQILDSLAAAEPDRIVYSVAEFLEDGPKFREITARAFAQAVDKTAWWIQKCMKELPVPSEADDEHKDNSTEVATPKVEPLGYIGPRKPTNTVDMNSQAKT
jgi:hypothetical protein